MYKVAVVVGSLSANSINRKLAQALAKLGGSRFSFTLVRDDDLPLYNRDLDNNLPAPVVRFKQEIEAADALLFVTPEYLRSIPGSLKNALEWGSRPYDRSSWTGRPAAIAGTSPGAIGTATAQQHLRNILSHLNVAVLPQPEVFVTVREGLIAEDGSITDEKTRAFLEGFLTTFETWIGRFVGPR